MTSLSSATTERLRLPPVPEPPAGWAKDDDPETFVDPAKYGDVKALLLRDFSDGKTPLKPARNLLPINSGPINVFCSFYSAKTEFAGAGEKYTNPFSQPVVGFYPIHGDPPPTTGPSASSGRNGARLSYRPGKNGAALEDILGLAAFIARNNTDAARDRWAEALSVSVRDLKQTLPVLPIGAAIDRLIHDGDLSAKSIRRAPGSVFLLIQWGAPTQTIPDHPGSTTGFNGFTLSSLVCLIVKLCKRILPVDYDSGAVSSSSSSSSSSFPSETVGGATAVLRGIAHRLSRILWPPSNPSVVSGGGHGSHGSPSSVAAVGGQGQTTEHSSLPIQRLPLLLRDEGVYDQYVHLFAEAMVDFLQKAALYDDEVARYFDPEGHHKPRLVATLRCRSEPSFEIPLLVHLRHSVEAMRRDARQNDDIATSTIEYYSLSDSGRTGPREQATHTPVVTTQTSNRFVMLRRERSADPAENRPMAYVITGKPRILSMLIEIRRFSDGFLCKFPAYGYSAERDLSADILVMPLDANTQLHVRVNVNATLWHGPRVVTFPNLNSQDPIVKQYDFTTARGVDAELSLEIALSISPKTPIGHMRARFSKNPRLSLYSKTRGDYVRAVYELQSDAPEFCEIRALAFAQATTETKVNIEALGAQGHFPHPPGMLPSPGDFHVSHVCVKTLDDAPIPDAAAMPSPLSLAALYRAVRTRFAEDHAKKLYTLPDLERAFERAHTDSSGASSSSSSSSSSSRSRITSRTEPRVHRETLSAEVDFQTSTSATLKRKNRRPTTSSSTLDPIQPMPCCFTSC